MTRRIAEPLKTTPDIAQAGAVVLRTRAALVEPDELGSRELRTLVDAMVATMRAAPGVGLAAPQIGVSKQVIVLEDHEELMGRLTPEARRERGRTPFPLMAIVNPTLVSVGDERATFFEGCLSVRGYMALVERSLRVEVRGVDPEGAPVRWSASGWPARIAQHEVDHLAGTLYVDRMWTRSLCCDEEARTWIGKPVAEVLASLDITAARDRR